MKIPLDKPLFKKYLYLSVMFWGVILFYEIIININYIGVLILSIFKSVVSIFTPFIYGFIMAYLLYKPIRFIEKKILAFNFFKKHIKISRLLAIFLVYCIVILSLYFFINSMIPKLIDSLKTLVDKAPQIVDNTQDNITRFTKNNAVLSNIMGDAQNSIENIELKETIQKFIFDKFDDKGMLLNNIFIIGFEKIMMVSSWFIQIILSVFIGIYVLLDKEILWRQFSKFFKIILGKNMYKRTVKLLQISDEVFYKFFTGKIICSVILGIVCFIGLLLIRINHPMLISFIIGITNMVPFFGPILGVVPGVLITLLYDPIKAVWLIILVIIIQQIEENIIAPKIIGNIIGLSPFWIICAIILGGEIFGIIGMFIAVPIFAILRIFIIEWINVHDARRINDE